jgi:hypothetical protein
MIKVTAKIENEEPQIKDKECFFWNPRQIQPAGFYILLRNRNSIKVQNKNICLSKHLYH